VTAGRLKAKDWLRSLSGTRSTVTATRRYFRRHTSVYNLTIGTDHTYYVNTARSAILVHNCPMPKRRVGGAARRKFLAGSSMVDTLLTWESPVQAATRIVNEHYVDGEWQKGPDSEFNKIVKSVSRAWK
jgi:hypothetical protein